MHTSPSAGSFASFSIAPRGLFRVLASALVLTALTAAEARAQYTRVSVASDGTPGDNASFNPSMSGDGRFVAFQSRASNLVPNDTNGAMDIFVRDLQTQTTTRVSVTSTGGEGTDPSGSTNPHISRDGRFVAFQTRSPLVPHDTPCNVPAHSCTEAIYVHDRQTGATTRVSVSSGGQQANGIATDPTISGDGRYVVFSSHASNLVSGDTNNAADIFLHDRQTGTTTLVGLLPNGVHTSARNGRISADGQFILYETFARPGDLPQCMTPEACPVTVVRERATGQMTLLETFPAPSPGSYVSEAGPVGISDDGRIVLARRVLGFETHFVHQGVAYDRLTGRTYPTPSFPSAISGDGRVVSHNDGFLDLNSGLIDTLPTVQGSADALSTDARFVALSSESRLVPGDTDLFSDVYVHDRDPDGDHLPTGWETTFGLNPNDATDAAGDADSDGQTNLQEFQSGTHPTGTLKRYLAEGAANTFFTTRIALFNPGDTAASVVMTLLGSGGTNTPRIYVLPARSRHSVDITGFSITSESDFSTVVESDRLVVVDRTMTWDATGFGTHTETSIAAPSTTWYLAEGATHGSFDLFYLFQNPNDVETTVTVNYLRGAPLAPIVKNYTVPARSRRTIYVDEEGPGLESADLAASITSTLPIIVERAMYASTPMQAFAAGHGGAALTTPQEQWFLAEGATGSFFDLFVLVGNPGNAAANLRVTYLLPSGDPIVKQYTVGPQNRLTISVDGEDPRLSDTPVSVIVESTNSQPVVVERAMWWPSGAWYEAHLSAGSTTTGTTWAVADGEAGRTGEVGRTADAYLLIANTGATAGSATITLFVGGSAIMAPLVVTHTVELPADSRTTVDVRSLLPGPSKFEPYVFRQFSALVESTVPVVVERALYSSPTDGLLWSAGSSSLATKLQ